MKTTLIRVIILFVGLIIAHFGVSLFLLADLGSDPFNVMIQGLSRSAANMTGASIITHGNTHMAVSILIIIVLLFVDRTYIKIGTLICMFCGGPIIDVFNMMLGTFITPESAMEVRVIGNVLGCIILALGMSVVIKSDAGTGPNDLVGVVISDKLKKKFSIVRMMVDACFLVCGWLLGGVVGIGTVICLFLVGPVAGFFLPKSEKVINRIVGCSDTTL
ncbi:MAG: hypothetical protein MJZ01_08415 [Bacteroidales bacterium]|nr:hypothetical protein [Bacteroidales bacterium]